MPAHFTSAPCLISEAMCTTSGLYAQVDFRSKMCAIAFLDRGAFAVTNSGRSIICRVLFAGILVSLMFLMGEGASLKAKRDSPRKRRSSCGRIPFPDCGNIKCCSQT